MTRRLIGGNQVAQHYAFAVEARPDLGLQRGEGDQMAEWVKRDHTKGEIDRAGEILVRWWTGLPTRTLADMEEAERLECLDAIGVAQNWRTSHAMPLLTFRMGLSQRAKRVERNAIVAQRMKRMASVLNKLRRENTMKLSQMQDLGGCRAIVSSPTEVRRLFEMYRRHNPSLFPSEGSLKCYDYISEPKEDGYRGIHVVGRYAARVGTNAPWNGQRIEIQLRSQLQHAFATAVETVTTFTREPLKFGAGPEEWRRFFSLVGSAFAIREGTSQVPGTPSDEKELGRELFDITQALKVKQKLNGWADALKTLPRRNMQGAKWLLLVLDTSVNTIRVTGYADRTEATDTIAALEKSGKIGQLDAVLVWVKSAKSLKSAYPNYYADTHAFTEALEAALQSLR
jgi:hypothetical protein